MLQIGDLDWVILVPLSACAGFLIGLGLNVVVERLPRSIESAWLAQAREAFLAAGATPSPDDAMTTPDRQASAQVPAVGEGPPPPHRAVRWTVGARRLVLPGFNALAFAGCAMCYGLTFPGVAAMLFCAVLITLAFIDAQTSLLPDILTLPLLWAGLLINTSFDSWTSLEGAVWGAAGGYLLPWAISQLFRLATGKEGMGYGDFKLLAALGAWFGWMNLPWMILAASVLGIIVAVAARLARRVNAGEPLPFGPYLAIVGITAMLLPIGQIG